MKPIICPKQGFKDRAEAASVMRSVIRRNGGNKSRGQAGVYKCDGCGLWHWGHAANESKRFGRAYTNK